MSSSLNYYFLTKITCTPESSSAVTRGYENEYEYLSLYEKSNEFLPHYDLVKIYSMPTYLCSGEKRSTVITSDLGNMMTLSGLFSQNVKSSVQSHRQHFLGLKHILHDTDLCVCTFNAF